MAVIYLLIGLFIGYLYAKQRIKDYKQSYREGFEASTGTVPFSNTEQLNIHSTETNEDELQSSVEEEEQTYVPRRERWDD